MERFGAGYVEEGLVDGDLLDRRRVPTQDLHDLLADGAVLAPVDGHEDRARAEPSSRTQGHGRMDAVRARLVGGSRDDAAVRTTADTYDHGFPAQLRTISLLDGSEERVEVDVEDGGALHRTMM